MLPSVRSHGTATAYRYGCRCYPCSEAHASAMRTHRLKLHLLTEHEDAAMPDYQLALKLSSPHKDRIRAYRLGEEHGYTGQRATSDNADYLAGYRAGAQSLRDYHAIARTKTEADRPARRIGRLLRLR